MQEKDKTSISKQQKIIIKLNPNYHAGRANYIPSQEEELADLIVDRVRKYEQFLKENSDLRDEDLYDALKRYDSIHINGARGSGKSTVIKFLAESQDCNVCSELQEKVEFLSIIDPNQLDKDTIIIDIVTDVIYSHATAYFKNKNKDRELYKIISDYKCQIDKLTFATHQQDYDNYVIRQETTREENKLDYTFHRYAEACCKLLGKKALVLPLDDIDMRLDKGVDILETIRKYFQTPHLIPVIALDSAQAYALVKKGYYKKFDFEAKVSHRDIESGSGMGFLKKLPSEYLQKILPPSQRIALYDMLDYYKDEYYYIHNKDKLRYKNHKPIYFYKELKNGSSKDKEVTLSFTDMIKLIMNVLFDYKGAEDMFSPDDYRIVNYLKNKSFRSFLDDARALMRGLEYDDKFTYKDEALATFKLNTGHLKTRFELYSRGNASNKYDGAMWFWDRYIDRVYAELDKVGKKDDYYKVDYIVTDLIDEILVIDPHDTSSLGRKEKIYYRLFLQEFFIEETHIEFASNSDYEYNGIQRIIKKYNFQGYMEFLMRTIFPATIFELLVNEKIISVLKFPIEQLRDFSSPASKTTLIKLYDEWLPFWTELYPNTNKDGLEEKRLKNIHPLAIEIDTNYTRSFRKEVLSFTTKENFLDGEQRYYAHPFKMLSFLAGYTTDVGDDFYYDYMPKGYLGLRAGSVKSFKDNIEKIISNYNKAKSTTFLHDEIILSIVDSILTVKNISKNILLGLMVQANNRKSEFYISLSKEYKLNEKYISLLYRIELRKNISVGTANFFNGLLEMLLRQTSFSEINENINGYMTKHGYRKGIGKLKFGISNTPLLAGVNKKSILLPFIVDDPLLRNLRLMGQSKIVEDSGIIDYLRLFFHATELNKVYFPQNKYILNLFETHTCQYPKTVREAIANALVKEDTIELKLAYYELFSVHVRKIGMKTKFCDLYKLMKKIDVNFTEILQYMKISQNKAKQKSKIETIFEKKNIDVNADEFIKCQKIINILLDKKRMYKEDDDYLKYNITILLIDALEARNNFGTELISYINSKSINAS